MMFHYFLKMCVRLIPYQVTFGFPVLYKSLKLTIFNYFVNVNYHSSYSIPSTEHLFLVIVKEMCTICVLLLCSLSYVSESSLDCIKSVIRVANSNKRWKAVYPLIPPGIRYHAYPSRSNATVGRTQVTIAIYSK